MDKNVALQIR